MKIRTERKSDWKDIYQVNLSAFDTEAEAKLVNALREQACPIVSLVAVDNGELVGHILFSPVTLTGFLEIKLMGLAPMSAVPTRQRQGIGAALVREGLTRCKRLGFAAEGCSATRDIIHALVLCRLPDLASIRNMTRRMTLSWRWN